jgi:hypothetical protein
MALTGTALMTAMAIPYPSRYLQDKFGADPIDFVEVFEVSGIMEFLSRRSISPFQLPFRRKSSLKTLVIRFSAS